MTWDQICHSESYRGRWVALDDCRYDEATHQPAEGCVIDVDEDLAELCGRVKASDKRHCAILFCSRDGRSMNPPLDPFRRHAH